MKRIVAVALSLVVVVLSASLAHAGPYAMRFPYQKQTNLAAGTYKLIFSLWTEPSGGTPVWTSETVKLTLKTPLLIYTLGSGTKKIPETIDFSGQLYIQVKRVGVAKPVVAREPFPVVPYALWSDNALAIVAGGVDNAMLADGAVTNAKVTGPIATAKLNVGTAAGTVAAGDHGHNYDGSYVNVSGDTMTGKLNLPVDGLAVGTSQLALSGGNVGIGTAAPGAKLDVAGGIRASGNVTAGTVESTSGGIKFPDGTVQATAAIAAMPSWGQIIPGAERWQSVLGGTAALDRETGLVWQKQTDAVARDWVSAGTYCHDIALGGRKDWKGWRLPTIEELSTLIDTTMVNPALPSGHPFTDPANILASYYWSSTSYASFPDLAWHVYFYNGYVDANFKSLASFYVRCVRGGQ